MPRIGYLELVADRWQAPEPPTGCWGGGVSPSNRATACLIADWEAVT